MTAQQTTVHLDPIAVGKAVDGALAKLHQDGVHPAGTPIDRAVDLGLITEAEASFLRTLLALAQSGKKMVPATVVKDIDTVLTDGTVESPVAIGILKTIRFVAEAHVQATGRPQTQQLLSQPPPPPLEAAAEGVVLGGCGGSAAGVAIGVAVGTAAGGPWGAAAGSVIGGGLGGVVGAVFGGVVRGFGAWMSE